MRCGRAGLGWATPLAVPCSCFCSGAAAEPRGEAAGLLGEGGCRVPPLLVSVQKERENAGPDAAGAVL